jgi:hypothetical protein
MKAKFISTVVRAASVAAIPLAILVVAVPASAQHSGKHNPSERRGNGDQEAIAQMQRDRAGVIGVDPRESIGYGNSSERQDRRYQNENDENDHYKNKNRKHGDYKSKNRNYKNGYYRHGGGHDEYDNNRNDNERDANGRYPGRYPSRGAGQYPSSPVIPGFPSSSVPNGRGGKTLPGTNPQYQRAHSPYRGN